MDQNSTHNDPKQAIKDAEILCLHEIMDVLKKHNCHLEVSFQEDVVLGQPVLKYSPIIVYNTLKST